MRASFVSAAFMAFVSAAFAQTANFDAMTSPTKDETVAVGSTLNIVWQPGTETGKVSILLLQGATPDTLNVGPTLASGVDNTVGKLAWTIPAGTAGFATYGIKIELDSAPSTFQYSFPFHISGGSSSASGSASITAPASSSLAPSSSVNSTSPTSTKTVTLSHGTGYTKPTASPTHNSTITKPSTVPTTSKAASNVTVSTTMIVSSTPSSLTSASIAASTPAASQTATPNAAVANMASGGLAVIGGVLVALLM